ncbi:hypothetical protein N431DRAFT_471708 [Stipitochalara longipes BDJ]|nr:hypothetical protein N431DRAFT_471708 [Stipitochalara longipes BDJ]
MNDSKTAAPNGVAQINKTNDVALEGAITASIKNSCVLSTGTIPSSLKRRRSCMDELTDGMEDVIHVDSALTTEVERFLNHDQVVNSRDHFELELRTTNVAKRLFFARQLPPSQLDIQGKVVMDWTGFLSFVRHVALFLMLHDGKFSPAAWKERLALKEKIHDKFENRVFGDLFSRWHVNAKPGTRIAENNFGDAVEQHASQSTSCALLASLFENAFANLLGSGFFVFWLTS